MINVQPAPVSDNFVQRVQVPGWTRLVQDGQNLDGPPTAKYKYKPHWIKVIPYALQVYRNTCAYFGIHIPDNSGSAEIDHYLHKSNHATRLAYDWANYRLACKKANSKKGTKQVLDPFFVQDQWFLLDLQSGFLSLNLGLIPLELQDLARYTISTEGLELNRASLVKERRQWYNWYRGGLNAQLLATLCPIVYRQMVLQGVL